MLARRLGQTLLWMFALSIVAGALLRVTSVVRDQLVAPFDLISEGPHMSTIKAIRAGQNIYDPASFLDLPLVMTPYTPLYHVLVAGLPADPENPFFTGRLVALLFMLGAAASLGALAWRRRELWPVGLIALALFLLIRSVVGNTAYLRSDSTALFFSVWAVVSAARAGAERRSVIAAALLSVLAVAGKQSMVAAGGACLLYFLLRDRRRAGLFLASALGAGAVLALVATLVWGSGFWLAVTIPMTDYPRDWEACLAHWQMMLDQPVFLLLVALALGLSAVVVATEPAALVAAPYFIYMLLAWATGAWIMTGIGAENHNLIEPILATLLWMTSTLADRADRWRGSWATVAAAGVVVIAIAVAAALELTGAERAEYSYTTPLATERYVENRAQIRAALGTLGIAHGRMLNFKNSQVTHDFEGEMNLNDPWMYITVLFQSRPVTVARLVHAIETRYFDAVLVQPRLTSAAGQTTDNPTQHIIRTIFRHYALRVRGGEVNVLTPIAP